MTDEARQLATLARLSPAQWLRYAVRLAWTPSVAGAWTWLVGSGSRILAWHTACGLLRVTAVVLWLTAALDRTPEPAPAAAPAPAPAPHAPADRTTVTAAGVRVRDKRKVPRATIPPPAPPSVPGSRRPADSWTRVCTPW